MARTLPAPAKPRVAVLATGGTIAGARVSGSARGYRAGVYSVQSLIAAAPGIGDLAKLDVVSVARIGSQDMDEAVWRDLAKRTQEAVDDPAVAGVVGRPSRRRRARRAGGRQRRDPLRPRGGED